jgi:hypothetical protein
MLEAYKIHLEQWKWPKDTWNTSTSKGEKDWQQIHLTYAATFLLAAGERVLEICARNPSTGKNSENVSQDVYTNICTS